MFKVKKLRSELGLQCRGEKREERKSEACDCTSAGNSIVAFFDVVATVLGAREHDVDVAAADVLLV